VFAQLLESSEDMFLMGNGAQRGAPHRKTLEISPLPSCASALRLARDARRRACATPGNVIEYESSSVHKRLGHSILGCASASARFTPLSTDGGKTGMKKRLPPSRGR
jgi:hypothetical protein